MAKKAVAEKVSKPNLFAKAASAQKPAAKKKDKGTVLELPIEVSTNPLDAENHRKMTPACARLHDAITTMFEQDLIKKTAEGKLNTAKGTVMPVAIDLLVEEWAKGGVLPGTPIKIQNDKGEAVTFVLQDKSKQYSLSDEQIEQLEEILGEDAAQLVVEKTEYTLDEGVLAEEGVGEKLSAAIQDALDEDQAERLLKANTVKRLHPTAVARLAEISRKDPVRMKMLLEAFGSSAVKYLKC